MRTLRAVLPLLHANPAVGPWGSDPIDRTDRSTAAIDHDTHQDFPGIDGAEHIRRPFALWWPQR
jgi:hypothetical protein